MPGPCPVIHFEMPYRDANRMAGFYESAFGWKTQNLGDEMGNYVLAETTETADGRSTTPGAVNGGFYQLDADAPQHPSVVIAVENLDASIEAVATAGGNVLGEPIEIPGVGRYVSFTDTEGNRTGMLQPGG